MNTTVETFVSEDIQPLVYENEKLDEYKKLVEDLGLEGQKKMYSGKSENTSPNPFLFLNKSQKEILSTLCPVSVSPKSFDKGTIPLEVLSLIALCEKEGYFHKLEIWHDDVQPDPVLIGISDNSWIPDSFLIARWGAEKLSWEKLEKLAIDRLTKTKKRELETKIHEAKERLSNIDNYVRKQMSGEYVSW